MPLILPTLKLLHSFIIIYLTFLLYQINRTLPASYIGAQLLLTLIITLFDRKQHSRDWKQLFFSLSLVYALRTTQLNFLRFIFLVKIFYLHSALAQVSQNLLTGSLKIFRLTKILFDLLRLLTVFYLTLGIMIVVYKYWAYLWTDPEKVLSTHQILYFFMITSSSIGYGDITPKNEYQMYFLIVFIPVLIVAFGQMCGHAVGYFTQFVAILRENPQSNLKSTQLNPSIWGQQTCTDLINYITHAQSLNSSIHSDQLTFANHWLSLACKHHQAHQPLLAQILDPSDSREYKLLVASKLKRQFFPNNWRIIQKGNIDRHIYLIEEGEVEVNGQVLTAGKTFNLDGFTKQQPCRETYLTKSFTSVWMISQDELMEIGRSSVSLKNKISKRFSEGKESL